jgi:hypothetical protein
MDRGSSFPVELPPVEIGVSNVQSGPSEFLGQKQLQESTSTACVEVLREGKDWKRSAVHRGRTRSASHPATNSCLMFAAHIEETRASVRYLHAKGSRVAAHFPRPK